MGLKESIVVRSEYTIKNSSKKGGSRGGTPGNFVLQYMSREDATEIITPVTIDGEPFGDRYRARREITEKAVSEYDMNRLFHKTQKRGGVAFNEHELSLSYKELVMSSKAIQDAFHEGKTVMKTIISFDEEYLREYGIIPDTFHLRYRGDFKGNIDQMKLRYAIASGMERASEDYDDLHYVGTIQVDTEHIHCHLAMVDMGRGDITEDGTQRGKISAYTKNKIRHGIDTALADAKEVHFMASSVQLDNSNKTLYYNQFIYKNMKLYGAPQQIMTVLPEDRKLWYAGSGKKEMEQADRLCHAYVKYMLLQDGSGFGDSMQTIMQYANMRQAKENLDDEQKEGIIRNGREAVIKEGMNDVYEIFREFPMAVQNATPVQNLASQEIIYPSFKNDLQDFVYRTRTYKERYHHHKNEAERFAGYISDYEKERMAGNASDDSYMLYSYFNVEQEYQSMLAEKYAYFIKADVSVDQLALEYVELSQRARRIHFMELLREDDSLREMNADEAEAYGREKYDVYGGRYIVESPEIFTERIRKNESSYIRDYAEFQSKLDRLQLILTLNEDGSPHIRYHPKYAFKDVKGLDLHELKGDFNKPLEFSDSVRDVYMRMAEKRIRAYDAACAYLDGTGQSQMKHKFDSEDIELMRSTYKDMGANRNIEPVWHPPNEVKQRRTIVLNKNTHMQMREAVYNNLSQNLVKCQVEEARKNNETEYEYQGGMDV
ncbi:hypothetical protein FMM75_23140 [Lachnospiraceae bacterium MD335]|nr:hypothetical protein [Lachnospiraceae bacterium MD335]